MVDEAEDSMLGQQGQPHRSKRQIDSPPASPGPRKRKPGIHKHINNDAICVS